jgi:hypothetical protein
LVTINSNVSAGIAIIVILCIFPWVCSFTQAQTVVSFQPSDKFSIPSNNGSVSFAVNGTYSNATFENDTWTFVNLHLSGSQPLEDFTFSTQDSNVTIFSYRSNNNTSFQSVRIKYAVEGQGKQTLNLGLGPEKGGSSSSLEWSVIVNNNVFLAQGEGWTISDDGTMVINGATGNVSVVHYGFFGSFGNGLQNSNLPFYQQHSVAIAIGAAAAIVVVISVVINLKIRKSPKKITLVENV